MSRISGAVFFLLCAFPAIGTAQAALHDAPIRKVFFDARRQQTQYAGPGREIRPPGNVDEILIGYFGPSDPSHPEGGDMWCAAQLAVEEANSKGGYRGKRFRLVPAWSENPWGTGVSQLARIVYRDKVWAIIGGIDGPSTHLAEQVVAKARLTLISPGGTDKTANLANVPWMFSCLPGDHLQAPVLAAEISTRVEEEPFILVSTKDHDSRLYALELTRHFLAHRMAPAYRFEWEAETADVTALAARIMETRIGAAVLVAGAGDCARLVTALRGQGFTGIVFGGPSMGRRRFLEQAGGAAEGVIFPLLYTSDTSSGRFERELASRSGHAPDYLAASAYDAVNLLLAAIQKAGLNRVRIGDAVRDASGWRGVAGPIRWDSLGANCRPVHLGTICNRQIQALSPMASDRSDLLRRLRTSLGQR